MNNKKLLLFTLEHSDLYNHLLSMSFFDSIKSFFDSYESFINNGTIKENEIDENSIIIINFFKSKFINICSDPNSNWGDIIIRNHRLRETKITNNYKINFIKDKIINEFDIIISKSPRNKKQGCYIATMAYGDYEHPQVLILRQFRDDVLYKSIMGKWFIKTYYNYSPILVEKFKNKKALNNIIRKTLNQFIKLIKK
jgi:hypothetical protein